MFNEYFALWLRNRGRGLSAAILRLQATPPLQTSLTLTSLLPWYYFFGNSKIIKQTKLSHRHSQSQIPQHFLHLQTISVKSLKFQTPFNVIFIFLFFKFFVCFESLLKLRGTLLKKLSSLFIKSWAHFEKKLSLFWSVS